MITVVSVVGKYAHIYLRYVEFPADGGCNWNNTVLHAVKSKRGQMYNFHVSSWKIRLTNFFEKKTTDKIHCTSIKNFTDVVKKVVGAISSTLYMKDFTLQDSAHRFICNWMIRRILRTVVISRTRIWTLKTKHYTNLFKNFYTVFMYTCIYHNSVSRGY